MRSYMLAAIVMVACVSAQQPIPYRNCSDPDQTPLLVVQNVLATPPVIGTTLLLLLQGSLTVNGNFAITEDARAILRVSLLGVEIYREDVFLCTWIRNANDNCPKPPLSTVSTSATFPIPPFTLPGTYSVTLEAQEQGSEIFCVASDVELIRPE